MAYLTPDDLTAEIRQAMLAVAADDDRDLVADAAVLEVICQEGSDAVDAFLAARYAVPVVDPPALVRRAAKVFAMEIVARRSGAEPDKNPWTEEANGLRKHLVLVRDGKLPLDAMREPQNTPGAVVSEAVRSYGTWVL